MKAVKLKVLVVDDSVVFARSACTFLAQDSRLDVLPAATSAGEALRSVEQHQPDLVVMDINMPVMDGLAATLHIKARQSPPKVVAISAEDFPERAAAAAKAGADAFLAKSHIGERLLPLIDLLFTSPLPPGADTL